MAIEPDAQQFAEVAAVAGGDSDGPVVMLNLNRYRERAAYERYGPLGPPDVTVRSTRHFGPHQGHGSETIVDLVIEPQQRKVRVKVLSVRRPDAQLTCRAVRETPATEYQSVAAATDCTSITSTDTVTGSFASGTTGA